MKQLEIFKLANMIGHRNPVYAMEISDTGSLYTAGNDRGIVEWEVASLAFSRVLCPVHTTVYSLRLLPENGLLAAGMQDGSLILADCGSGQVRRRRRHHEKPIFALDSLRNEVGNCLLAGSEDGTASIWEVETMQLLQEWQVSETAIRCTAVSPDGQWFAFGSKDGVIHLYRTGDRSLERQWEAHELTVTSLRFSPDGQYLLSGGRDARMKVFRLDDYSQHMDFVPHLFAVYSIRYHPELPFFATASRDKSIKIWSSDDFRLLRTISNEKGFEGHQHSVNDLAWSSDGKRLFSVGDDRVVMVWNLNGLFN